MTQEGLNQRLLQVVEQALALNLPVSSRICPNVRINSRAVSRFGCCIRRGEAYFIELSDKFLEAAENACLQTLAHEVLHTCPGCRDHGTRWKEYAARMNQAYGYTITRTGAYDTLGLPDNTPVRYLLVCQHCGQTFPRVRASRLVRHPEHYRCKCGGTLELRD